MAFNANKIISDYEAAYLAYNKRPVQVKHTGQGWFVLSRADTTIETFRTSEIVKATGVLSARVKQNKMLLSQSN